MELDFSSANSILFLFCSVNQIDTGRIPIYETDDDSISVLDKRDIISPQNLDTGYCVFREIVVKQQVEDGRNVSYIKDITPPPPSPLQVLSLP